MPNMWKSDGSPAYDDHETEGEYQARRQWDPDWGGYVRSRKLPARTTAAQDFATPLPEVGA